MRILFCVACLTMALQSASYSCDVNDGTKEINSHVNISLRNECDKNLYAFCQAAILHDRGLACSPFAGSSDKWILEKLLTSRGLFTTLDELPVPLIVEKGEAIQTVSVPRSGAGQDDVLAVYQASDKFSSTLELKITPHQKQRLPYIYIHMEGCMALCRPQFAGLLEKAEKQKVVRQIIQEASTERVLPLHRSLFGLQTVDQAPIYQAELRRISAETDWKIIEIMNDAERKRLWALISSSRKIKSVVHGAPSFN